MRADRLVESAPTPDQDSVTSSANPPTPKWASSTDRRPAISTAIKIVVVLALFGGLAVALEGGWERIRDVQWQFEPWSVAASAALLIAASVWGALAWFIVARAFGSSIAVLPALRIYSQSNLGKYLPGKVLHAVARVYLAQQQGMPVTLATSVVLIDVVMYIAAGLLVIVAALPTIVGPMIQRINDGSAAAVDSGPLVAVAIVGLVVGLGMLHPAALNWSFGIARRIMPSREFPTINASYATMLSIFLLYLILWALYTVSLYAGILSVISIDVTQLPTLGAIYALSYLAGLLMPIAPAGLGVREGLMALLLAQLVPYPAALAASVLVRVLQVAAEGLCAAAFSRA
ncbi:MAG: lysylphosphatidylglycerol synthase transmembrane domain-containing protein [Chloroflexota bacterium]